MNRADFAVLVVFVAACGDNGKEPDYLGYDWDGRRVLCSDDLDNLDETVDVGFIHSQIEAAGKGGWALVLHAHQPTVTISNTWLDQVLTWADQNRLAYYTFRELVPDAPAPKHPGLALAFDDDSVDDWMMSRQVLADHGAHVTYFVTRFTELTPPELAELKVLYGDGHDIEPHTVNHLNAIDYVNMNGLDAYIANEVLPSFQVLVDAGYPPAAAFAYPFGAHTPEIDTAVLQYVDKVRTTPGECPWAGWGD